MHLSLGPTHVSFKNIAIYTIYLLLSKKATCVLNMWTSQVHIPIFEYLDETYYYDSTTSLYKKKALITAWLVKKFQTTTSLKL